MQHQWSQIDKLLTNGPAIKAEAVLGHMHCVQTQSMQGVEEEDLKLHRDQAEYNLVKWKHLMYKDTCKDV